MKKINSLFRSLSPFLRAKSFVSSYFRVRLFLLALLLPCAASAQIFTGGVGVLGSSNALVQVSFLPVTNLAYSSLVQRTLQIQNVQTNETITVAYGYIFSGNGLTNVYCLATNVYTFPASNGWVTGSTFTTNIGATTFSVPVQPVGLIQIYSNAVPWSNNVIFQ
jgi:hypothetical protein